MTAFGTQRKKMRAIPAFRCCPFCDIRADGFGRLSRVEIVLPHLRRRKRLSAKAGLRALETKWLSDLNRMARDSARTL